VTEHTPLPVAGYTPQSDDKVALANELKQAEERYLRVIDRVWALANYKTIEQGAERYPAPIYNLGMLHKAREFMQNANMWAVRAIFQPTRIELPEDK
jgi:hypothetical protein